MAVDIRICTSFPGHRKTLKLSRRLGDSAVLSLLRLWTYTREYRSDGMLSGMDVEDIEIAAGWTGESGRFVAECYDIGWLDRHNDGTYECHDWADHQPWSIGEEQRSDVGRFKRLKQIAPDVHRRMEKDGVTTISKEDYEVIRKSQRATAGQLPGNARKPAGSQPAPFLSSPKPEPKSKEKSQSAKETEVVTPPAAESPAVAEKADGQAVTESPPRRTETENRLLAAAQAIRSDLERKYPLLDFEIEMAELCAKFRDRAIGADAEYFVRRCFRTAEENRKNRASPENPVVEGIRQANQLAVHGFAGGDQGRLRFAMVMNWLAEKYPLKGSPRPLSVTFLLDYYEGLADVEIEDVEAGARWHHNKASRFFPQTPPVLRESIQAVVAQRARRSFEASHQHVTSEPEDAEELRKYYQDTIDGMQLMGLDTTGWYVDETGDRPRLVTRVW